MSKKLRQSEGKGLGMLRTGGIEMGTVMGQLFRLTDPRT